MPVSLAHPLQRLHWDNLSAHDVELQVCRQLLESMAGAGDSYFQSALSLATISGQDLGLPNIERISSRWVLTLTGGSPDRPCVARSQLVSVTSCCLPAMPKIQMVRCKAANSGCVCLYTRAEGEFDSAEQCFKSISNLGLWKCWCDLVMVGIKPLESARKYNPEKKFSFEKDMNMYILKGK